MSHRRPRLGDKEDSDPVYEQDQWREGWGRYKVWQDKVECERLKAPGMSWDDWKIRAEWERCRASEESPSSKDKASRPNSGGVPPTDSDEDWERAMYEYKADFNRFVKSKTKVPPPRPP
jgi:hypothetical protein